MTAPRKHEHLGPPWPELLTVRQAAAFLNVAEDTVKFWVWRERTLSYVSIGTGSRRLCRIRLSVLQEMVKRGEQPAFKVVQGAKR